MKKMRGKRAIYKGGSAARPEASSLELDGPIWAHLGACSSPILATVQLLEVNQERFRPRSAIVTKAKENRRFGPNR